ncbi:MAG: IclR family transcriptional regulator C-terminal domain-containing protein, partial [Candidatus Acidiferrales bacterium]
IAAPIWDHTGAVNTSLSVTGPAVRMSTPRLRELASLVRAASLKISRELGFSPPANRKSAAVRPAAIRGSKARIVRPVLHARIAAK